MSNPYVSSASMLDTEFGDERAWRAVLFGAATFLALEWINSMTHYLFGKAWLMAHGASLQQAYLMLLRESWSQWLSVAMAVPMLSFSGVATASLSLKGARRNTACAAVLYMLAMGLALANQEYGMPVWVSLLCVGILPLPCSLLGAHGYVMWHRRRVP